MNKYEKAKEELKNILEPLVKLQQKTSNKASEEKEIYQNKIDDLNKKISKLIANRMLAEIRGSKDKDIEAFKSKEIELNKELESTRKMYTSIERFVDDALKEEYREIGQQIISSKEFKTYGHELINRCAEISERFKNIKIEQEVLKLKYEQEKRELQNEKNSISRHFDLLQPLQFCMKISGALPKSDAIQGTPSELIDMAINGDIVFDEAEQEKKAIYKMEYPVVYQGVNALENEKQINDFYQGKPMYTNNLYQTRR